MATRIPEQRDVLAMATSLHKASSIDTLSAAKSWEPQKYLTDIEMQAVRCSQELFALYSLMAEAALAT